MTFTDKIFKRATIRGVTDYLLYGIGPNVDTRDYKTRLDDAYLEFEKAAIQYDQNNNFKLLDCANQMNSKVASVYMEIGIQAGILLMKDFQCNVNQEGKTDMVDYQAMYNSLFKDITNALKPLQDLEEEGVKEATEILKSAQRITEEIFINSENAMNE